MNKDNTIPKDKQKMIDSICITIIVVTLFITLAFISNGDTNHENNKLRNKIVILETQLEDARNTLKDVQSTLKVIDEEFGEYVYMIENERKESEQE